MKLKFFLLIWITFLVAISASSYFYSKLIAVERQHGIDTQIEINANLLINSAFIAAKHEELDEAEEIIAEAMGGYRLGLVILVRDRRGRIVYQNKNARQLKLDPDYKRDWQFIEAGGNSVRLYSKPVPTERKIIQFGTMVPRANASTLFVRVFKGPFLLGLIVGSAVVAFILTTLLLTPLRRLAGYLNELAHNLEPRLLTAVNLPRSLERARQGPLMKFDELNLLLSSVQSFLAQVVGALKINVAHSARLAHEINTPLAIIKSEMDRLKAEPRSFSPERLERVSQEVERLGSFVHDYLTWSENLNALRPSELYAIKIEPFVRELAVRMEPIAKGRLRIEAEQSEGVILASSTDLEHVLMNLIQNALKYSPANSPVLVRVRADRIEVVDQGPGIPLPIISNLGEPFNVMKDRTGAVRKGTGLGLALVALICKKHHWSLEIRNPTPESTEGTIVSVKFSNS